jgi:hypothetical protein
MKRMARIAVLISLVEELRNNDNWCGETHIQKATYFLQRMLGVDLGHEFILYKHGPYSFDLSEELGHLRADNLLEVMPQSPYGPRMLPGEAWADLKENFPKTIGLHAEKVAFLGEWLGNKGVAELEKLATALYVTMELHIEKGRRAEKIHELKPHVSLEEAQAALEELDMNAETAKELANAA